MPTDTPTPEDPFHIVVSDNDNGPYAKVGICVNDGLKEFLTSEKAIDAHLLVVVRKGENELERHVVPIAKGFTPVTFTRSGDITVDMMVVYPDRNTPVHRMRQLFEERSRSKTYRYAVYTGYDDAVHGGWYEDLSHPDSKRRKYAEVSRFPHVATHRFTVLSDNFAEPPRPITQSFLSLYYHPDEYDQCDVRGKIIKSVFKTIFILPLHYLIKFIGIFVYSLTGFVYGLQYKTALRPYRHGSFTAVFGGVKKRSAWYFKKDEHGYYKHRSDTWSVLFTAFLILSVIFVFVLLASGSVWPALITVGVVVALVVLLVIGVTIFDAISDSNMRENFKAKRKAKREAREAAERDYFASLLDEISCNTTGTPMTMERLVGRRKHAPTVVFRNLKEKVCLPYEK